MNSCDVQWLKWEMRWTKRRCDAWLGTKTMIKVWYERTKWKVIDPIRWQVPTYPVVESGQNIVRNDVWFEIKKSYLR